MLPPWIRESVRHCETCGEATPHSRRAFALPPLLGAGLLATGAGTLALSGTWWPAGALAAFVGVFVILWDRERFWRVACERCRGKRVAESRRLGPTFDGTTMIDPL